MLNSHHTILTPTNAHCPLLLSSPHSGRTYPDDLHSVCDKELLRQTEDAYVDELIAGGLESGVTILQTEFPRCYIDVNRAESDMDPAVVTAWPHPLHPSKRTLQGLGLIRRMCKNNKPMYDAPLSSAEAQHRIEDYYRPYHHAIDALMQKNCREFGVAYLLDCHSMPSEQWLPPHNRQPDFVLGDRDGTSCDTAFTRRVYAYLLDRGYSVALNHPYKGAEITRRYGKPAANHHALQIEINRGLYMEETTVTKHAGFTKLRDHLTELFAYLSHTLSTEHSLREAAE